jgi:hypothetical protein
LLGVAVGIAQVLVDELLPVIPKDKAGVINQIQNQIR